jgi:hypothetical protein
MADTAELAKVFKTIILEIFPEMGGYHFPIKAKVVKVYEAAGKVGEFNKQYSVDVQPLKPDGSNDDSQPVIPDVEVPVIWAGPNRGIFCLPVKGAIVRIGYYYNDPSYPFVDAILAEGFDVPEHALNSIVVQHSDGTRIEIDKNKNIYLSTPEKIFLAGGGHPIAFADVIKVVFDGHTHPDAQGGSTGAPTQQMTGHLSPQVFTG